MCDFQDGHQDWLHFVPAHRHLSTLFASNHDLACELRSRVGIAKSAFAQLSRPVLTNKHMPVKLRLQFFHSLISTKLFFVLGSWPTPTPKLLSGKKFDTNRGLLSHQRKSHRLFSLEHQFLQGRTCLHCGKFPWTTQRLQQHLAYIPKSLGYKPCYCALVSQQRQVPYAKDRNTTLRFAGLTRLQALQTAGPEVEQASATEVCRQAMLTELAACQGRLEIPFVPPQHDAWVNKLVRSSQTGLSSIV